MNPLRGTEKWRKIKLFLSLLWDKHSFFHVRILFYVKNHLERSNEKLLFFAVCFSQFSFLLSFPLTLECRLIAWMHLLNVNIMRNHRKKKKFQSISLDVVHSCDVHTMHIICGYMYSLQQQPFLIFLCALFKHFFLFSTLFIFPMCAFDVSWNLWKNMK